MVLVVKKNIVTERYPTSVNLGRSQLVVQLNVSLLKSSDW